MEEPLWLFWPLHSASSCRFTRTRNKPTSRRVTKKSDHQPLVSSWSPRSRSCHDHAIRSHHYLAAALSLLPPQNLDVLPCSYTFSRAAACCQSFKILRTWLRGLLVKLRCHDDGQEVYSKSKDLMMTSKRSDDKAIQKALCDLYLVCIIVLKVVMIFLRWCGDLKILRS